MTNGSGIWVLLDDRAGNRSQALGVAEALAHPFHKKKIEYGLLAKLPNLLLGQSWAGITGETASKLTPPWPRLVIAAGRRTAPVALGIKHQAGARCRLVQIMDPGDRAHEFDLVAVPQHDGAPLSSNHLHILGAPHRVTADRLAGYAEPAGEPWADLPKPWIAALVGGSTRRRVFTEAMAVEMSEILTEMAKKSGGSVLVTTSRRSGAAATDRLRMGLKAPNWFHDWRSADVNPYFAYLAQADAILVTGESVSMVSEAAGTGAPVYVYAPDALIGGKHRRMIDYLTRAGHLQQYEGELDLRPSKPLNAATDIAAEIKKRFPEIGG